MERPKSAVLQKYLNPDTGNGPIQPYAANKTPEVGSKKKARVKNSAVKKAKNHNRNNTEVEYEATSETKVSSTRKVTREVNSTNTYLTYGIKNVVNADRFVSRLGNK